MNPASLILLRVRKNIAVTLLYGLEMTRAMLEPSVPVIFRAVPLLSNHGRSISLFGMAYGVPSPRLHFILPLYLLAYYYLFHPRILVIASKLLKAPLLTPDQMAAAEPR